LDFHAFVAEDSGTVTMLVCCGWRHKGKPTLAACSTRQARFVRGKRGLSYQRRGSR
jgi:hypothetical protein